MPKRKNDHGQLDLLDVPAVIKLWQIEGLFSDHYLRARLNKNDWWPGDEAARPLWEFCRDLHDRRAFALRKFDNEMGNRSEFIDKILARLGFAWSDNLRLPETSQDMEPDYLVYDSEATKESVIDQDIAHRYRAAVALLEAKKFGHPLSQVSRHQQRYPHQQIRDYLQEAQSLRWGILTNGAVWRLYCRDSKPSEYFALNFEFALQSLENFKFFVALFSPAAFRPEADGKCRLDHVREQSLSAQAQLEEDLRQRVFTILADLANGFASRPENAIPDTAAGHQALYENCLIYLYRLLFLLYAEGRGLLPVEPRSRRYYKELSLERLKPELKTFTDHDSQTRTRLGEDIGELFRLVNGDDEAKNKEYKVARYNGGLFDPANHPLLENWRIADADLAGVLRGLMFDPPPEPDKPTLPIQSVDFGDLRVQQLGSIYEGLLEHHFARDAGGRLELKTDKAERKATGTYYTPDYIVKYIAEQTLTPLLDEIERSEPVRSAREAQRKDDSFANAVLALNVCDPAMGSGHFLVEATIILADHIAAHPTTARLSDTSKDEEELAHWRRRVVEACIYGVDLNPLAVELAKLSLWLTCIATDQPLNFLDHHLRCGNSLIGARLDQLGGLPDKKAKRGATVHQLGFTFGPDFTRAVADTIRAIKSIEGEASGDVAKVKGKERRWAAEILPRLAAYKRVADLWTANFFDAPLDEETYVARTREILAPHAGAKNGRAPRAQSQPAENRQPYQPHPRRFFHWELEFPDVFFAEDGSPKTNPGFDTVMGNPPWGAELSAQEKEFFRLLETDTSTPNSYIYFIRRGELLTQNDGYDGVVLPDSILVKDYSVTRGNLLHANTLTRIIYLDRAFKGVNHDSAILTWRRGTHPGLALKVGIVPRTETNLDSYLAPIPAAVFDNQEMEFRFNLNLTSPALRAMFERASTFPKMRELGEFHEGIHTGNIREKLFHRSKPKHHHPEKVKPCLIGGTYGDEFGRYHCLPAGNWTIYDSQLIDRDKGEYASLRDESIFTGEKLYVTRTGDEFFSFFDEAHYASNNLFSFKLKHGRKESHQFVMALLNGTFAQRFNRLFLAPRFGDLFTETKILHLDLLPVPRIAFTTPAAKRTALAAKAEKLHAGAVTANDAASVLAFVDEQLRAQPERSDAVHDLLAFLARRMMELNREQRAAARQFLTDLRDFHGLDARALTPKTKLDEFWKLETTEVFAHLGKNPKALAAAKLNLDSPTENKIRARFEKAKAAILPLEAQIAFTDRLIDQTVYRLYALTPAEIKIVEASAGAKS